MKNSFFETVKRFFLNIQQIKKDKDNRQLFIADMQQEIIDPKSRFNQLRLQCDPDYTHISTVVNLPAEFQLASLDIDKYRKLNELIRPINKYLISDLNWSEYLTVPEFYYIDSDTDVDDTSDEISCAYIASWKYKPVLDKYPNFKYQLAAFTGINIGIIAGIILMCIFI